MRVNVAFLALFACALGACPSFHADPLPNAPKWTVTLNGDSGTVTVL